MSGLLRRLTDYRHVIWDWNGTLLDDTNVIIDVMNGMLERRSLPLLTPERYREVFTFPVRDYYAAIGLDLDAEPFSGLADEWIGDFLPRSREAGLRRGASIALSEVSARGLSQSILSAAEQELLCGQVSHFEITHHFAHLRGIDNHRAESKLELGRTLLAELELPPGDILMVGDTLHDAEVAWALGFDAVLIEGGHQSRARLATANVPVLDSLEALLSV